MSATSAREEILGDIERALQREGNPPSSDARPWISIQPARSVGEITSDGDRRPDELIGQFESELKSVGGHFHRAATSEAALEHVNQIASDRQARIVVSYDTDLIAGIDLGKRIEESGVKFLTEKQEDFIRTATVADIGLSGVDFALADTGTLVLEARKDHARSISLLPPVHIAVLRPEQIIPGLSELFPLLRRGAETEGGYLSSAVTFITGPSRTADIELTLVVGVHGPQQLHVILLAG